MSELHKPATPGPWRVAVDYKLDAFILHDIDDRRSTAVAAVVGQVPDDAEAIADLWGWIERAERYEEALLEIKRRAVAWNAADVDELRLIATDALREEGRP